MFGYIYRVFIIAWKILCCRFLCESFYKKRKYSSGVTDTVVLLLSLGAVYVSAYSFGDAIWFIQMVVIMILSLAMYALFESSLIKISVFVLLYQVISLLVDNLTLWGFGKVFPKITLVMHATAYHAFVIIIGKIIQFIMILIIKRGMERKSGEMLNRSEWFRMMLIPFVTIILLIAIMVKYDVMEKYNVMENIDENQVLLYVALGMAVMNINVFYLIHSILERETVINRDKLFREKIKHETERYYAMSENLEEQRKKAHEFKNHMAYIFALANKEAYQELKEYIKKIDNDLKVSMDMVDTNNAIVNAVLNAKYREAVDKGIVFILKVNDLSQICLPDVDIVVMLSNLLNNAMESCEISEEKVIKLKFILENGQILLSVKNSMSKSPVKRNGVFLSQKEDAENHGMGIANIIDVVERHGGRYVIDYDDNSFSFTILLDNK